MTASFNPEPNHTGTLNGATTFQPESRGEGPHPIISEQKRSYTVARNLHAYTAKTNYKLDTIAGETHYYNPN